MAAPDQPNKQNKSRGDALPADTSGKSRTSAVSGTSGAGAPIRRSAVFVPGKVEEGPAPSRASGSASVPSAPSGAGPASVPPARSGLPALMQRPLDLTQIINWLQADGWITPELALATIEAITVLGALQASAEVKAALADRIE